MTTELTNHEVINLIKSQELIDILLDLIRQYESVVLLTQDNRDIGCISEITVLSECFTKKHLNILFQYCDWEEVVFSKKHQALRVRLEISL